MTWRVSPHYGIRPSSNAPLIPADPTLKLVPYMAGGTGTESLLLERPLRHEVPRVYWRSAGINPGSIYLIAEISDMPVITGEEEAEFKGFPWNVCFYAACLGLQSEGFIAELQKHVTDGSSLEPWFAWDTMHGGRSAPVFQFDSDTEEVAKAGAQQVVPWVEENFMKLMLKPLNKIGSHGFDWLRGDLVSRPELANIAGSRAGIILP